MPECITPYVLTASVETTVTDSEKTVVPGIGKPDFGLHGGCRTGHDIKLQTCKFSKSMQLSQTPSDP